MNKIKIILILITCIFSLSGCSNNKLNNKFVDATLDEQNNIVIDSTNINSKAEFINYELDNIKVQFIAVKGTDNSIKITFNTCQICNSAPEAYFVQEGDYFVCQNCKNKFHVDELGLTKGECHPIPVEEKEEKNNQILISKDYIKNYKDNFINWAGPIN